MQVNQVVTAFVRTTPAGEKTYHNAYRFDAMSKQDSNVLVKKLVLHINDKERVEVILDSRPIEDIDLDATRPTTE